MADVSSDLLSDEDFMNQVVPTLYEESVSVVEAQTPNEELPPQEEVLEPVQELEQPQPVEEPAHVEESPQEDTAGTPEGEAGGTQGEEATEAAVTSEEVNPLDLTTPVAGSTPAAETPAINYEDFHKMIMKPFKASGKMIEPRNPEEVVQLMQMGANYARKMHELAPYRRSIKMLEKHGLLDENKLSFLIDLDGKNPEAIKKLISESGMDPLDIDITAGHNYSGNDHRMSDVEFNFRTVVDEVKDLPDGTDTIKAVAAWDDQSQTKLWENPNDLKVLHEHRTNGVFDLVVDEVERQQVLGNISPTVSFYDAYVQVAAQMIEHAKGDKQQQAPAALVAPTPVATRTAAPKPVVANGNKVSAASAPRSGNKVAASVRYDLMTDEEFMKHFNGRV